METRENGDGGDVEEKWWISGIQRGMWMTVGNRVGGGELWRAYFSWLLVVGASVKNVQR